VLERRLDLVDSQLAFASLAALDGPARLADAEALSEIAQRGGLYRAQRRLDEWITARNISP
jgi:hypothetical protein